MFSFFNSPICLCSYTGIKMLIFLFNTIKETGTILLSDSSYKIVMACRFPSCEKKPQTYDDIYTYIVKLV